MARLTPADVRRHATLLGAGDYDSWTDLTREAINEGYRATAKTCHPDSGHYDPKMWFMVQHAKDALDEWITIEERRRAQKAKECPVCNGVGKVEITSAGFGSGMIKVCLPCNGTGLRKEKQDV